MIFPVNYVFDQDLVIFRTDPGTKLDAASEGGLVAFEVDAVDTATQTGWSVVVRGTLGEVTDAAHLERLRALPLYPRALERRPVRARAAAHGHWPSHQDPRRPTLLPSALTAGRGGACGKR
jgi:nitroimidazol reductase NimA-like FMN-containing flavoprotein (pyridoxamine 5'-phosphate oxidase superfamily)